MSKISALTALSGAPASGDLLPIVDVSDTSQAPTGTNKKVTIEGLGSGIITFLPYRIERGLYSGKVLDFTGILVNAHSLFVSPDETKLWALPSNGGAGAGKVHQYSMSTPGDLDTATLDGTFTVSGSDSDPQCITFNAAGTRMYMTGQTSDAVYQFNLGTAWEIVADPPTAAGSVVVSSVASAPDGILISPAGTTFLVASGTSVFQYTLSTPDEIIGGSMAYASISASSMTAEGMCWAPGLDGTAGGRIFHATGNTVAIRDCPTPYSLSGSAASLIAAYNPTEQGSFYDVKFVSGGMRMWLIGPNPTQILEYYTSAAVPAA